MNSLSPTLSQTFRGKTQTVRFGQGADSKTEATKPESTNLEVKLSPLEVKLASGSKYHTDWGAAILTLFLAGLTTLSGRQVNTEVNTPEAHASSLLNDNRNRIMKPNIDDAVLQQRFFTYLTNIKQHVQLKTTDDFVAELLKKQPDLTKEEIEFTRQLVDEYKALPADEKNTDAPKQEFLRMKTIANKWIDKIIEPRSGKEAAFRMKANVDALEGKMNSISVVAYGLLTVLLGIITFASTSFIVRKNED